MEQAELMRPTLCRTCGNMIMASYYKYNHEYIVKAYCRVCKKWLRYFINDADEVSNIHNLALDDQAKFEDWALKVKARDKWRCRICQRPGDQYPLHAHHIIPKYRDFEMRYWTNLNNGITLCEQCHELVHGEWMKKYRKE